MMLREVLQKHYERAKADVLKSQDDDQDEEEKMILPVTVGESTSDPNRAAAEGLISEAMANMDEASRAAHAAREVTSARMELV